MIDWSTATASILNLLLTGGMLVFAVKVAQAFGRSIVGGAWRYFVVAATVGVVVALIAIGVAFGFLDLPAWWREGG